MHWVAEKGYLGIAKILINNGANLGQADNDGHTPLHEATRWGQKKMIKFFLALGSDPNLKDAYGRGTLHIAIAKGDDYIVKLLKDNGARL